MPRKRANRFLISLTDDELKHVDECASRCGLKRDQYTRMLYRKVIPPPVISVEMNEVIKQLRRIGNNLNQIAFVANKENMINADLYKKNYEELQEVIFNIKTILMTPQKMED